MVSDNCSRIHFSGKSKFLFFENLPLYKRVIEVYENNNLEVNKNNIFINGELAKDYTFKQDYYWLMGDNRGNSQDSRSWGFVPFDHVVGKPVFIWMSIDGINDGIKNWKIRWDRVFTTIHNDGEPKSYLIHFLVFCLLTWIVNKFFLKKLSLNG